MLFGKNIMKITKSYLKILIKEEIEKSNIDKARDQLEELVNKDQDLNEDPPARIPLQKKKYGLLYKKILTLFLVIKKILINGEIVFQKHFCLFNIWITLLMNKNNF